MKKIINYIKMFKHIPQVIRFLWGEDKGYVICIFFEALFMAISPYPSIYLVKYTVDMMSDQIKYLDYISVVTVLLLIILLCSILHYYFNSKVSRLKMQKITNNIANQFYMKSATCKYECLTDSEFLDKKELASYFTQGGLSKLSWNIVFLVSSSMSILFSLYLLASIDYLSVIIVIISVVIEGRMMIKKTEVNRKNQDKVNIIKRKYNYYMGVGSDGKYFKDIIIFNMAKNLNSKANESFDDFYNIDKKNIDYNNAYSIKYNIVDFVVMFFVYTLISINIVYFGKSIGYIAVALNVVKTFKSSLTNATSQMSNYYDNILLMESFTEYMRFESEDENEPLNEISIESILPIETIEFREVDFKYPGQTTYALRNVSLSINKDDNIAMIGFNGAGKTTFLKLLMRLYDPTSGEILINGVNIKHINRKLYYSIVAPIFQDFSIFSFTIKENITALHECDEDKIIVSICKSDLKDKTIKLSRGIDTYINKIYDKNGIQLSGGEQQRLAFARCIYKNDAQIMVFDEPTASLDPVAEYNLYQKYKSEINNSVSFFVSHRLSCVNICNKIMMFDNGNVIAYGSHAELIEQCAKYREMYELQRSLYT